MDERSKKRWGRWNGVGREKIALPILIGNGPFSPNVWNDLKPMGCPRVMTNEGL